MEFESGVYTVIPTFFKDGDIDLEQLTNAVRIQISSGIKNIVLLGTTSETPTLTSSEQEKIVQTVWNQFNGQVNIIVGIGGNDTKATLENAFKFKPMCDAFMVTVPYYNKPSQEGIFKHFSTISQLVGDKPIMMYNIPSRCGVSMTPETIAELYCNHDNIVAIKEASGSISQTLEIKNLCDIKVFSGDDALTLSLMSVGAEGVISVASNIIPSLMISLVDKFSKQTEEAICLNKKLYPLFKSLFLDTNPVPLKYLTYKLGLAKDHSVRLPLVDISSEEILNKLNIISEKINKNELSCIV